MNSFIYICDEMLSSFVSLPKVRTLQEIPYYNNYIYTKSRLIAVHK